MATPTTSAGTVPNRRGGAGPASPERVEEAGRGDHGQARRDDQQDEGHSGSSSSASSARSSRRRSDGDSSDGEAAGGSFAVDPAGTVHRRRAKTPRARPTRSSTAGASHTSTPRPVRGGDSRIQSP